MHFSATSRAIPIVNFLHLIEELVPVLHFYFFEAQHDAFRYEEHSELARNLLDAIEAERSAIMRSLQG